MAVFGSKKYTSHYSGLQQIPSPSSGSKRFATHYTPIKKQGCCVILQLLAVLRQLEECQNFFLKSTRLWTRI